MIGLLGCALPPVEVESTALTVADLWDGAAAVGDTVVVAPLVVTSPRTADGTAFTVADPAGGSRSGLLVRLAAVIEDWPPPVGTAVALDVVVDASGPPEVRMFSESDGARLGTGVLPAPATGGEDLAHALVAMRGVTVTSAPDPAGNADADGAWDVGGRFGVSPGWNRSGDLVGVLLGDRVCARTTADWSGDLAGDPPVDADLAGLSDLPDGTPVAVRDLALATPWSRDGRQAVLQDADGRGVWVDGEAWGLSALVATGARGAWTGEVRHRDEGLVLRVWDVPDVRGAREARVGTALEDGAVVAVSASGIGPPDALGERPTDGGIVLDDRFVPLDGLPDPADLVGAVDVRAGGVLVAPF